MTYYQEFEGMVMFRLPHREKDALVKIFTKEYGKMMFFLRDIHKKNHPLQSVTVPFTKAHFLGHISRQGLSFLSDSRQVRVFRTIPSDIYKHAYATYLFHLADAVLEDRVPDEKLYTFIYRTLWALENSENPSIILYYFELHMLNFFGIPIQLTHCCQCMESRGVFDFSIKEQSILCEKHFEIDLHRLHISPKAMYIIRQLKAIEDPLKIGKISISVDTEEEMKRLLDTLYEEFVGIHLKSKRYINSLNNWDNSLVKQK